jgi:hypothetical protein
MDAQLQPTVLNVSPTGHVVRARFRRRVALALIGLGVLGALLLGGRWSLMTTGLTRGLPSEVPLPAQSTFIKRTQPECTNCTGQSWYYTVGSTQPQQIADFYNGQLSARGWQEVGCQLYSPEHAHCLAHNNHLVLTVMGDSRPLFNITPPRGGVMLAIVLLGIS